MKNAHVYDRPKPSLFVFSCRRLIAKPSARDATTSNTHLDIGDGRRPDGSTKACGSVVGAAHFNDRLLLGLKGTMSEAELHVLRARLRGGLLNKARRGELRCPLPAGMVYDASGRVGLDPDKRVQETVRLLFETFARTGTLRATIQYFRQQHLLFPTRVSAGVHKGDLIWTPLSLGRACTAMHNPWYAGAYAYGRGRFRKQADGRLRHERLPREQWQVLILNAHPGYISWQEYERNEQQLQQSAKALSFERNAGPPREGPALLQGKAVCGLCGSRMNAERF